MSQRRHELLTRVSVLAKRLSDTLEHREFWVLGVCSTLYLAVMCSIASHRLLENDELFTLNIARLPTMRDVWSALLTGAEQLPPFFYVLTRGSLFLLGENSLALRLPAVLGVGVMGLCLYVFVTKRATPLCGVVAMLLSWATNCGYYAFQARPYGLILGFSGIALICWQTLAEGNRRLAPLAGLLCSLTAAIACHYYAVLVLIPFVAGEMARTLSRRKIDFGVWLALSAPLIPLLAHIPLIQSARSYSTAFWAQPSWMNIPQFYGFLLRSVDVPIATILITAAICAATLPREFWQSNDPARFSLRGHEVAAAVGFLSIPFFAVALAIFVTRAFTDRYALWAVLGLCVLMPLAFHELLRGQRILMLFLIALLAFSVVQRRDIMLKESADHSESRDGGVNLLQADWARNLPIVCADPHIFLDLSYYAPPNVRARLVYLADPEASLRRLGHNSVERGMLDLLKPWFHLNVLGYRSYMQSEHPFVLFVDSQNILNWILDDLPSSHAKIEFKSGHNEYLLFLVTPAGKPDDEVKPY